jgi:hypothetical protein
MRHNAQIAALNQRCLESTSANWTLGNILCEEIDDFIVHISGFTFAYDGTIFEPDWDMIEDPTVQFLSSST